MAVSEVQVCNLALAHVGTKSTIASLDEKSAEAKACKLFFEPIRDEVLAAQHWGFAKKYQALADLGSPPSEWAYRYAYPTDCIEARYIVPPTKADAHPPFEIGLNDDATGRTILTDIAAASLCYTARVTPAHLFPPRFVTALGWRLAAAIAPGLTAKLDIERKCMQAYQAALVGAETANAREGTGLTSPEAAWIKDRG